MENFLELDESPAVVEPEAEVQPEAPPPQKIKIALDPSIISAEVGKAQTTVASLRRELAAKSVEVVQLGRVLTMYTQTGGTPTEALRLQVLEANLKEANDRYTEVVAENAILLQRTEMLIAMYTGQEQVDLGPILRDAKVQQLQQLNQELQKQVEDLSNALSLERSTKAEVSKLEGGWHKQRDEFEARIGQLQHEGEQARGKVGEQARAIEEMRQQMAMRDEQIRNLTYQTSEEAQSARYKELTEVHRNLLTQARELENLVAAERSQKEQAVAAWQEYTRKQADDARLHVTALQGRVAQLELDLKTAAAGGHVTVSVDSGKIAAMEQSMRVAQAQLNDATRKLAEAESRAGVAEARVGSLETALQEQRQNNAAEAAGESRVAALEHAWAAALQRTQELETELVSHQQSRSQDQQALQRVAELEARLHATVQQLQLANAGLHSAAKRVSHMEAQLEQAEITLHDLKEAAAKAEAPQQEEAPPEPPPKPVRPCITDVEDTYHRAVLMQAMGRADEASELFAQLVEEAPHFYMAQYYYAKDAVTRNDIETARAHFETGYDLAIEARDAEFQAMFVEEMAAMGIKPKSAVAPAAPSTAWPAPFVVADEEVMEGSPFAEGATQEPVLEAPLLPKRPDSKMSDKPAFLIPMSEPTAAEPTPTDDDLLFEGPALLPAETTPTSAPLAQPAPIAAEPIEEPAQQPPVEPQPEEKPPEPEPPPSLESNLARARDLLALHDFGAAIALLEATLTEHPTEVALYETLALALYRHGEDALALRLCERASWLHPQAGALDSCLAQLPSRPPGDPAALLRASKEEPANHQIILELAEAYVAADKPGLAVVQYQKLVKLAESASVHVSLGRAYARLNRADFALKSYRSAAAVDALAVENAEAARYLMEHGSQDEAVATLRKVLENPTLSGHELALLRERLRQLGDEG